MATRYALVYGGNCASSELNPHSGRTSVRKTAPNKPGNINMCIHVASTICNHICTHCPQLTAVANKGACVAGLNLIGKAGELRERGDAGADDGEAAKKVAKAAGGLFLVGILWCVLSGVLSPCANLGFDRAEQSGFHLTISWGARTHQARNQCSTRLAVYAKVR